MALTVLLVEPEEALRERVARLAREGRVLAAHRVDGAQARAAILQASSRHRRATPHWAPSTMTLFKEFGRLIFRERMTGTPNNGGV